jgi:hypothetical protein
MKIFIDLLFLEPVPNWEWVFGWVVGSPTAPFWGSPLSFVKHNLIYLQQVTFLLLFYIVSIPHKGNPTTLYSVVTLFARECHVIGHVARDTRAVLLSGKRRSKESRGGTGNPVSGQKAAKMTNA